MILSDQVEAQKMDVLFNAGAQAVDDSREGKWNASEVSRAQMEQEFPTDF